MGKLIAVLTACLIGGMAYGQEPAQLQETARNFQRLGDYENAVLVLKKASAEDPGNLELKRDLAVNYYLLRQYGLAADLLKGMLEKPAADEQMFQMAALAQRGLLNLKEADRIYKAGLKKFPGSGVLYCEYGNLLQAKEPGQGLEIVQWEKGIEVDPEYPGNFFYAAKYHDGTSNALWSLLYGEVFVNLESYTARTTEIKILLLSGYKKLFAFGIAAIKGKNTFENSAISNIQNSNSLAANGISPESLTAIRTRFVLDWFSQPATQKLPFKLFDLHQQMLRQGLFEAYNQWLFGTAANMAAYQNWTSSHQAEYNAFNQFQRNRVFKVPAGQYYNNQF